MWCGDISDFVQWDGVVVIIFQNIVAQIRIIVVIVIIKHEIVVFRFFFLRLSLGVSSVSDHGAGLACFHNNGFTGVGADDRISVQVVEPFPGGRAEAFCAPLFLWHLIFLQQRRPLGRIVANCHKAQVESKAIGTGKYERRIWDV
jgi:hypothetical protein